MLFGVFNFLKNGLENLNFCTSLQGQSSFVRLLEELKSHNFLFEIDWPLVWPNITPNAQELICPICLHKPKSFNEKKASLGVQSLCLRETPAANQFKIPKCNPFISTFVSRFTECSLLRVLKCGTFLPNLLHSCTTDTKHFNNSTIQPSNKL